MHNNRVAADDGDGGGVGEIMEAIGGMHDRVGPLGNDNEHEEVSLNAEFDVLSVVDPADSDASPEKRPSSSYGAGVLRNGSTRIKQASQPLRRRTAFRRPSRIDRSNSAATHAIRKLKFITGTASGSDGWAAAERCFKKEAIEGLLPRSKFAKCIGMKEDAFAGELFDALARRRNIFGESINKAQLLDFWDQITGTSFDNRLQTFFDMVDKNADGSINEDEIAEIITLSASANKLTMGKEKCHEYARLIMEELDPRNDGYIELYKLERLLLQTPSESMRIRTNNGREMSEALPTAEEPNNPFRRLYRRASNFLEDNWRRCWVLLLWLSVCASLFAWKFVQYRHHAVFEVMGYCVCVAKGGAEMLKFNMALILLPVCRNTITWLRSRTAAGRLVPFDDSLRFHKVVAVGITVGAGLHIVSHMACDFPRLLHASEDDYESMKPFFGDVKPPNYWWFVKGTEGWTGLVMLLLMAIAFTLALPCFRKRKMPPPSNPKAKGRLPGPGPGAGNTSRNRLADSLRFLLDALLNRLTGFNAFWYTHHLFIAVYALLLVHGHFLYLTNKWQKKTTWMYLAVPIVIYACDRLIRTLRSRVRTVKNLKVAVHSDPPSLSLHFSRPEGFRYTSGQYIFVKCAAVSPFQWHPFSITSAPQDDYLSVHIRIVGDWTKKLQDVFIKFCQPPTEGKPRILRDGIISDPSFPKVLIDGPYGAPAQDYKKYDVVLLVGLGIGATPMVSIIKDIINNIKRLDGDVESGDAGASPAAFRTRQAYFYWVTREQGSFEWFRGVLDEVAAADKEGVIELHNHCTSVYEEGDARSALIAMLQSFNQAKNGVDLVSGARVKTHFGRPDWPQVYKRIAHRHEKQRVGVFYCGAPTLTGELRNLAKDFSTKTNTKFEFHCENF